MPDEFEHIQHDVPLMCDPEPLHEWHSTFTVCLGELIEDGAIDLDKGAWLTDFDAYNEEQRHNFLRKFANRYYFAEISITPPLKWEKYVMRIINENMSWLKFLYRLKDQAESTENLAEMTGEYEKYRKILSDFPQAQLSSNNDYASAGEDFEHQRIFSADIFDLAEKVRTGYVDPDLILLNRLERCFMPILTTSTSLSW